jgi:hypothetical protein
MIIFALLFIAVFIFWIYDANYRNSQQNNNNNYMNKQQRYFEAKRTLKKYFVDSVNNEEELKKYQGTPIESVLTLNLIANLHKSSLKNFLECRTPLGLTESEVIEIVKTVTNETMDIFISNSKQFHV